MIQTSLRVNKECDSFISLRSGLTLFSFNDIITIKINTKKGFKSLRKYTYNTFSKKLVVR